MFPPFASEFCRLFVKDKPKEEKEEVGKKASNKKFQMAKWKIKYMSKW